MATESKTQQWSQLAHELALLPLNHHAQGRPFEQTAVAIDSKLEPLVKALEAIREEIKGACLKSTATKLGAMSRVYKLAATALTAAGRKP